MYNLCIKPEIPLLFIQIHHISPFPAAPGIATKTTQSGRGGWQNEDKMKTEEEDADKVWHRKLQTLTQAELIDLIEFFTKRTRQASIHLANREKMARGPVIAMDTTQPSGPCRN